MYLIRDAGGIARRSEEAKKKKIQKGKAKAKNRRSVWTINLQRHQADNSDQDGEERSTEDVLALAGGTVALGGVCALGEAGRGGSLGAGGGGSASRRGVRARARIGVGHTAGATVGGRDAVGSGGGARSAGAFGTEIHVEASGAEGAEDGVVAGDSNVTLHGGGVG